ncbi:MAG: 16S rRNA (guanine(966)-N(2))-methyltransferase RsmD [Pyrinomonadaceae bacterium]
MRVISGLYGGRVLKSPSGLEIRPTSDRLRETLFNILNLQPDVGLRFLDLCAGTGAMGIEALSRGVQFVTFVDISRVACSLVKENLSKLNVPNSAFEVICAPAEEYLRFLQKAAVTQDIVVFDPPYETDYSSVLNFIGKSDVNIIASNGIFIAEHRSKNQLSDEYELLRRTRILKQGETSLSFFERA